MIGIQPARRLQLNVRLLLYIERDKNSGWASHVNNAKDSDPCCHDLTNINSSLRHRKCQGRGVTPL